MCHDKVDYLTFFFFIKLTDRYKRFLSKRSMTEINYKQHNIKMHVDIESF